MIQLHAIHRINAAGVPCHVGQLQLTHPRGCKFRLSENVGWLDEDVRQRCDSESLPYAIQDLRPQGFLGRHFARRYANQLKGSLDLALWSDDQTVNALLSFGLDAPGDLIFGDDVHEAWRRRADPSASTEGLTDSDLPDIYAAQVDSTTLYGQDGWPLPGEQPKFTALRHLPDIGPQHVLVKFSGSDNSPGTQRWSDLLICEQLAGQVLQAELGIASARSRIHRLDGRTFLEVDRFDRHGILGRSPLISWFSLNAALVGLTGRPWPEAVSHLRQPGWVTDEDLSTIQTLWLYGQLIGNTDMHDGNLSFRPVTTDRSSVLRLAPVYDMLPMTYAPVRGVELPDRAYTPRLPLPAEAPAWQDAARAALLFWQTAASDERISGSFRGICRANASSLAKLLPDSA